MREELILKEVKGLSSIPSHSMLKVQKTIMIMIMLIMNTMKPLLASFLPRALFPVATAKELMMLM